MAQNAEPDTSSSLGLVWITGALFD